MIKLFLFVASAALLLLFCLVMLIGVIGKGMTRSEQLAAFGALFACVSLLSLGVIF